MSFQPRCLATAIGSLPHPEGGRRRAGRPAAASPTRPIWPQLPASGMNEQMEVQYSEGMPRVVIDREKERMYFDTAGDSSMDLAAFYEKLHGRRTSTHFADHAGVLQGHLRHGSRAEGGRAEHGRS